MMIVQYPVRVLSSCVGTNNNTMRTSTNQYRLPTGELVYQHDERNLPTGAILWNGYDYEKQCWIYKGERDTRTLEELRESIEASKCPACGRATLRENEVENALSRYCSKHICNDCGMREAFEGDFWHGNALHGEIRAGAN